ncbi:FecR domain-containing protein [uncultured Parabacteroides sp.]|uniref:FecR family protein n=1 Tax=uncultured Parabacteroides sp. TaxID=512312 RepID=UPI0025FE640D|nr:FecR domain-containing protein [uncultured Parabacteroides sp.]
MIGNSDQNLDYALRAIQDPQLRETDEFLQWISVPENKELFWELMACKEAMIREKLDRRHRSRAKMRIWTAASVAAAIFVLAFLIPSFLSSPSSQKQQPIRFFAANNCGDHVILQIDGHDQQLLKDSVMDIKDWQVKALPATDTVAYLNLTTPRGKDFLLVLADGTKVWINAESTLRYPVAFRGKERRVELKGEACFEVAKDEEHPFIVRADGMDTRVLGTKFNVKAYKDDQTIDVSLVSGKVNVRLDDEMEHKGEVELHPNRMLRYNKETDRVEMKEIEGRDAYDWTNGTLRFEEKTFAEIAKDLERKYDLHIHIVSDKLKKEVFTGSFSGYYTLDDVLREVDVEHKYTWKQTANELVIRDK